MKILKLRFKNLNSLYGEWSIDFTQPEYEDQGIFAITGPTGSGKSTVLDAICLALYGMTPRLGRITKSGNEIMSRQTGECFAEVTFASQAGTYVCHWHQHRAYRRPDGVLAEAVHEIADAVSGQVLETKKRDVALTIEEKTGMDFERFTRSILLAQGGFAAFLQASPDERSPILEQITGTGIYSDISVRVHERQREEREKVTLLRTELSSIKALSDNELTVLRQNLADQRQQEKRLAAQSEALQKSLDWLDTIKKHEQYVQALDQQLQKQQKLQAEFQPQRDRLLQARRVLEIEGVYAALEARRQQQQSEQQALGAQLARLPELQQQHREQTAHLADAENKVQATRSALQAEMPILKQVRELDLQIRDAQRQSDSQRAALKEQNRQIDQDKKEQEKVLKEIETLQQEHKRITAWLLSHAADEQLAGQLAGIREQFSQLQQLAAELAERQRLAAAAEKRLDQAKKQQTAAETAVALALQAQEKDQENSRLQQERLAEILAGRTLRDLHQAHEAKWQSLVLLRTIASLEEERKRLQDGKPCPLCGATEHPYSVGQAPAIDETEQSIKALKQQIEQAETLEMAIRQLDQEAQAAVREFAKTESRLQQSRHELDNATAELDRINHEKQELKSRCDAYRAGLSAVLLPYGLTLPERAAALPDLLNQLAERARQWQSLKLQCQELDRKEQQKQAEHDRLTAVLLTRQDHLDQLQEQYEQQTRRTDLLRSQRSTLYGDKQADQEEQRFNQAVESAMQKEKEARAKLQQVITKTEQAETRVAALQESIALREPQINRLRSQFEDALKRLGLDGEAAFLSCRMPESERSRLAKLAEELDAREADLKVRKLTVEQELARERARALTDEPYEKVTEQRQTVVAQLQALHDSIGAIKQKLDDSEAARLLAEAKQRQIDAQMAECQRWDKLRDLIGSADGKKFRNFAQGLTFERMVAQANRQLAGMSDRYLLIRDEKMPLELNVIDNYQAGEIRSTKNLSGGESFIVSLALALGLSHMASRKVRVDSLFLDEGFGTLDEEALETALETLAGLHQSGKLIGIISHVPALKERIRTQLAINPVSGGKSVITGPGVCSRASAESR